MQAYIAITAHYIITETQGDAWELEEELFAFQEIEGQHSGENLAEYIFKVLDKFEILEKVQFFLSSIKYDYLGFFSSHSWVGSRLTTHPTMTLCWLG